MASKVEGLPISVLEAMSSGLPIITTPAGGVIDIVKHGINGFIVSHNDVNEMEKVMEKFLITDGLLEKMGKNARLQAIKYDIKNCIEKYQNLYESNF